MKRTVIAATVTALFWVATVAGAPKPLPVQLSGTITLVIINPPKPLDCDSRGFAFTYLPSGVVYRAHSGSYNTASKTLDLVPALDQCVFASGFEERL